jgi:hypothetical protein
MMITARNQSCGSAEFPDLFKGAILLSGIYDLAPLCAISQNAMLGLDLDGRLQPDAALFSIEHEAVCGVVRLRSGNLTTS